MQQGDAETRRNWDETAVVVAACIEVHRALGPGLLESTYEHCLEHELKLRGLRVERQIALPVHYKGLSVRDAYRVDLLIEGRILIEIKAVERLIPVHQAQTLTYLKLTSAEVALLVNFNAPTLKAGLRRYVRKGSAPAFSAPPGDSPPEPAAPRIRRE